MSKVINDKMLNKLLKEAVDLRKIAGIDNSGKSAPFGTGMKQAKHINKQQKDLIGHT